MSLRILSNIKPNQKIGEVLVQLGFLKQVDLDEALRQMRPGGPRLGFALVSKGTITDQQLAMALAKQFNMEFVDLDIVVPTPEALKSLPLEVMRKEMIVPLAVDGRVLAIAVHDPLGAMAIQSVVKAYNLEVKIKVASQKQIQRTLDNSFGKGDQLQKIVHGLVAQDDSSATIESLVNRIVENAVKNGASDIHVEPDESFIRVRERIDGVLEEVNTLPLELGAAVVSRFKILANLDFAEKRNSQDGRFTITIGSTRTDLRISTLPTVRGEKVVLRILDKTENRLDLSSLGFSPPMLNHVLQMLDRPHGIIFVTGPTGSGKSTTVYSMLGQLNSLEKNIVTIEDPVEYQFNVINQVQVQPKIGFTFATVLRGILRQDPDIIMVGEIRDKETAEIAIRAALTGHLVITTLHTNNSVSTITRLMDMGIETSLIASSLLGIVSQRLVRTLCAACKKAGHPSEVDLIGLKSKSMTAQTPIFTPVGCPICRKLGYKGRQPIFEVLVPDSTVRHSISTRQSEETIAGQVASLKDFKSMREDGIGRVLTGLTTPSEVLKATVSDS